MYQRIPKWTKIGLAAAWQLHVQVCLVPSGLKNNTLQIGSASISPNDTTHTAVRHVGHPQISQSQPGLRARHHHHFQKHKRGLPFGTYACTHRSVLVPKVLFFFGLARHHHTTAKPATPPCQDLLSILLITLRTAVCMRKAFVCHSRYYPMHPLLVLKISFSGPPLVRMVPQRKQSSKENYY